MYKLLLLLFVAYPQISGAQSTLYYKLVKVAVDEKVSTDVSGGQFITFAAGKCYESDKEGYSVENGSAEFKSEKNGVKTYVGDCYYGKGFLRFNTDYSKLNIVVDNAVYVYARSNAPAGTTTCSLIKSKPKKSQSISGPFIVPMANPQMTITTNNEQHQSGNSKQAQGGYKPTLNRYRCHHCGGKGERIQHEYVPTFGLDGPSKYCDKCRESWNHGTLHVHHTCVHCNGKGYIEKYE